MVAPVLIGLKAPDVPARQAGEGYCRASKPNCQRHFSTGKRVLPEIDRGRTACRSGGYAANGLLSLT